MAKKVSDLIYYSPWDASATRDEREQALDAGAELGYYQYETLDNIVNNFLVAYVGDDKILAKAKRYEVEWHAQRGIQEFNYDILRSRSSLERELDERLSFPLPHDFVAPIQVGWIDQFGSKHPVQPDKNISLSAPYLQDSDYEYIYDNNGNHAEAEHPEALERWRDNSIREQVRERALDYYYGYGFQNSDDYSYYYSTYFGRRYGLNPENYNLNGFYKIDERLGQIHFDSTFNQDDLVYIEYVSDGLCDNQDFSKVYVHKYAEDALYSYILWGLSRGRARIPEYQVNRFQKDKAAMMRNAKHRLSNWDPEELTKILRNKAKWIKH